MAYTIRQYETKAGKRYEVRYRKPDGSATGKRGFKRKMDADAWGAANVTTAKNVGAYIDPQAGRRLVEDFWHPWLAAKKTKAPSYVETLERDWRVHVAPKWGMREVQSITRDEVQMWVSALAESKSASVVLRAEGILRALLAKVKADKCIHDNPCDGLELPRKRRKKRVYLSIDQLLALADASDWRRPIVLTLGLYGLRWGEEACDGRRQSDLLFPDRRGGSYLRKTHGPCSTSSWFYWAKKRSLGDAIAESMTIHDLRHTCASLLVHAGANVKAVQRQLGHKSATMTLDVYADLFDDDLDAVGDAMDGLLVRAIGEGRSLAA